MPYSAGISVIIPAYNAENFIIQAIQSAQSQTHSPLEILVIDDGSTDSTGQVVEEYASSVNPSLIPIYLLRQKNSGPASARNYGARQAKGEWLAFLDADDTFLPEKLEKQMFYTNNPGVGLVHSRENVPTESVTFDTLWLRNQITNSTTLVRKKAFDRVGGFDEDRALIGVEDYNLWLRLAPHWDIATCPGQLIRYTPVPGSLSSQVERFVQAELVNLEKIARAFELPKAVVEKKRLAIFDEYGRLLLFERHLPSARHLLGSALRFQPTMRRLVWLTVAFAPPFLLNLRRSRRAAQVTEAAK